jgi:hypothetical protein
MLFVIAAIIIVNILYKIFTWNGNNIDDIKFMFETEENNEKFFDNV